MGGSIGTTYNSVSDDTSSKIELYSLDDFYRKNSDWIQGKIFKVKLHVTMNDEQVLQFIQVQNLEVNTYFSRNTVL